jgi:AcrR family transcriptional regulator
MWALSVPPASTPSGAVSALSIDQAKAALALARGGTVSAAADSIGVHRSSIYHWFKSDPNFKQAVEEIRREWNDRLIDEMRRLESLALLRLRHILEDDSVPAGVQLRAALTILTRLKESSVSPEWSLPHMESLGYTIEDDPLVVEPSAFDRIRQNSTLFASSGGESHPHGRPSS